MLHFGAVTHNKCEFEINLLTKNDPDQLPLDANDFFELYIED